VAAAVVLTACGGNPTGASGAVVLRGTVVGDASASASSAHAAASRARITVTVQEDPSLSTTVAGNGTFELSGLPEGEFHLVFTSNSVTLGTITITGAEPGQVIKITVQVTTTTVILIDIENADGDDDGDDEDEGEDGERTCAISGGKVGQKIELEGNAKTPAADGSSFELKVNGNRVKNGGKVMVTGGTPKCKGKPSTAECKVIDGSKVHVSGMLMTCDLVNATVAATEVKVQK
jgi:hypothetical protein